MNPSVSSPRNRRRSHRIALVLAAATSTISTTMAFHTPPTMVSMNPSFRLQSSQAIDFTTATRGNSNRQPQQRRKYQRKRSIPQSEREALRLKRNRQAKYEELKLDDPNLWSFESLFPDPVWDETSIEKDLFSVKQRDSDIKKLQREKKTVEAVTATAAATNIPTGATLAASSPVVDVAKTVLAYVDEIGTGVVLPPGVLPRKNTVGPKLQPTPPSPKNNKNKDRNNKTVQNSKKTSKPQTRGSGNSTTARVDPDLTQMVRDRMYGYRRTRSGQLQYETSLLGQDGAIQFREGVRLGNPLRVNADRLNYLAKKELRHGKVEEAQELYEIALNIDPRDGRAYLGMSRCAQRRRDFKLAQAWLSAGVAHSVSTPDDHIPNDRGANPFLLQALGSLEERMGRLSKAEALYESACRSRPTHAAAWVSLGQLRTRKLGSPPSAGRFCYQVAETELRRYNQKVPAHVYTAWASLEAANGETKRARQLYEMALDVDPRSSVAWLQLGVLESSQQNWSEAERCFESGLAKDRRNSRILQAYALMESKRPNVDTQKTIGLFERALKAKSRDAGALQAYALFVLNVLGDRDAARDLLRRGTQADKRHAPVWQAWGVLETRQGNAAEARSIFQEGIWACAQLTGGQSGGYRCARLWQAWGVLEAQEGDVAAARRCFSRALDADPRNVPAVTAWAGMEETLGNVRDARAIYERALVQFSAGSSEKMSVWRNYERLEERLNCPDEAKQIHQRSMREAMNRGVEGSSSSSSSSQSSDAPVSSSKQASSSKTTEAPADEAEVMRWNSGSSGMKAEVFLNDRSPPSKKKKNMPNGRP